MRTELTSVVVQCARWLPRRLLLLATCGLCLVAAVSCEPFLTRISVSSGGSLQKAIDSCLPGGTIEIESGAYYEELYIDKSLTLKCIGHSPAIIVGPGSDGQAVIEISGNQEKSEITAVSLSNLVIRGSYWNYWGGIRVTGTAKLLLESVEITGGSRGLTLGEYGCSGNGIWATIRDCTFNNCRLAGLSIRCTGEISVVDTKLDDNWFGALISSAGSVEFLRCSMSGNDHVGVDLQTTRVTLEETAIERNEYDGIQVQGGEVEIISCSVLDNGHDGLSIGWNADIHLRNTTIAGSGRYGLYDMADYLNWVFTGTLSGRGNIIRDNVQGDFNPPSLAEDLH